MVRDTNVLRVTECSPVSSLGDGNPTELDLGYVLIKLRTKN